MSDDDFVAIVVLAFVLTAILAPTALVVWLLLRALRRFRAADKARAAPPGFDVVEAKPSVVSNRYRLLALVLLHTVVVGCSGSPRALAREDAERFAQKAAQDRYEVDMVFSSPTRESDCWRFIGHVRGLENEQGGHYFVQVDDTANVKIIPGR